MRGAPLLAAAALAACAGPPADGLPAAGGAARADRPVAAARDAVPGVPQVSVDGAALAAPAFVAEMALLFPEESREVVRALLRAEFAAREGTRLGLTADEDEVAASLAAMEEGIGDPAAREAWARARHGRGWAEVREAYAERLRANQLYQLALRAGAAESGRLRLRWFLLAEEADARAVAERLRLGATPDAVAAGTLEPEAPEDLVPADLPEPWRGALAAAAPGEVVGPLRFEGDRAWRVALLVERLPPQAAPARAALLEGLRARPVSAVEARAWFEAMLRRYTASAGPLPVSSPSTVLERPR